MKAARLHARGAIPIVEDRPNLDPPLRGAVVRIDAAFVPSFMTKIVDDGGYLTPPLPFTPGMDAVGTIEAVGDEAVSLMPGARVYCNPFYSPRAESEPSCRAFIGSFALDVASVPLLEQWRDGAFAQRVALPLECIVPIPCDVNASAMTLCRLGWLGTAHAAFRKAAFRSGSDVIIDGASGLLGSSAVVLALALGAARVFAVGRSASSLDRLSALDERVICLDDPNRVDSADLLICCTDGGDGASLVALLTHLRRSGACIVIGAPKNAVPVSAGWLLGNDITLRGSLWHEQQDLSDLFNLSASSRLDLSVFSAETYPIEAIGAALRAARRRQNPLVHVALDFR